MHEVVTVPLQNAASFECLALKFSGPQPLLLLLIYRPPCSSSVFISELSELIMSVCPLYPAVLLVGDLNIHVDSKYCPFAVEFLNLLHALDFSQFINFATHTKGHTLDLVCSSGISPSNLHGLDLAVSDHKAVLFNIELPAPPQRLHASRTITCRNLKNISIPSVLDMLDTQLSSDYILSSTDDLVSTYNTLLSETLDHPAPLTS